MKERKRNWLREEKKESRKNIIISLLLFLLFISIGISLFDLEGITGASIGVSEETLKEAYLPECNPLIQSNGNGAISLLELCYCPTGSHRDGACSYSVEGPCTGCPVGACNAAYACSTGNGGTYGVGDTYRCQATCDGSGNCDYATNCEYCAGTSCQGSCPGCQYRVNFCSGGSCTYDLYDPDIAGNWCFTCFKSWNIGGEVAAATCCGDDSGENDITCAAAGGVAEDVCPESSDACCDLSTDCVSDNTCYANDSSHPSYSNINCEEGTWNYTSTCGTVNLDTNLSSDATSTGTCFVINASNIILDCAGYDINYSTAGVSGYGVNNTGFNNTTIKNCNVYESNSSGSDRHAIYFESVENGTIENNNITTIGTLGYGIYLNTSSANNILINNNISSDLTYEIFDDTGNSYVNYLIYNNSDGEIKWINDTDDGFLKNLTLNGSIESGTNLFIGSNVIALNTSAFSDSRINTTANLTLSGLSLNQIVDIKRVDYYTTSSSDVLSNGAICNGTSCFVLSFDNATDILEFNTSFFSSFAANGNSTPIASSVNITSSDSSNRTNGSLTGNYSYTDDDDDPETKTETIWFNGSELVSDLDNFTIVNFSNTTKGQLWTFSVRVYDNLSWSAWVNSSAMIIENTLPTHGTPTINSTLGTNISSENITVYNVSTEDKNNESIKNIFNWKLNGSSITVLNMPFENVSYNMSGDYSGWENNGTFQNATWNATGGYDGKGAYEFDGVSNYIELDNSSSFPDSTSQRTICAWAKTNTTDSGYRWMVAYGNASTSNAMFIGMAGDSIYGGAYGDDLFSTGFWTVGNWRHICLTYDGTTARLYGNGTLLSSASKTWNLVRNVVYIGKQVNGVEYWNGTIDDVMIFNRSLSPEQVLNIYNNRTDVLNWNETSRGDNWSACITPNDGEDNGIEKCSENLTILNSLPETTQVILNTTDNPTNSTNSNLTCYATFADNDSDPIYANVSWYNNSEFVYTTQTSIYTVGTEVNIANLTFTNTTEGQNWSCQVNAFDGTDNATSWLESNNVTINYQPTQGTPTINSTLGTNTSSENLTVYNVSTADADNDSVKNIFDWRLNGSSIAILNMPFEGGSSSNNNSNINDYSMFGNDGSENGGVTWNATGGYDGKGAFEFDGVNDYINCGNDSSLNLTNKFTISAWINPNSQDNDGSGFDVVIANDNYGSQRKFYLGISDEVSTLNKIAFICDSGNTCGISNSDIAYNTWSHIVVVYESGDQKIYINGQQDGIGNHAATLTAHTNTTIGKMDYDIHYFNGTIDDVLIFNYSLSPEQVLNLYNNRTDLLSWNDTTKNDNWSACITPNDGYEDGTEACSINLTVENTAPEASNLVINSTLGTNTSSENLTLYFETADNDSDDVKNITNWKLNGTSISVLNMPFENSNGNRSGDYSGRENNATFQNATWNSSGGYDGKGAFEFDGTGQYLSVADDTTIQFTEDNSFSIGFWFKSSAGGYTELISKRQVNDFYEIMLDSGHSLKARIGDGSNQLAIDLSPNVRDSEWHHVMMTYGSNALSFYVEGDYLTVDSSPTLSGVDTAGGVLTIGKGTNGWFNGSIDDVMIFNKTLSAEQIKTIYENKTYIVAASDISKEDNWSACITPNDGTEDGIEVCSENLTVKNTAPETTQVTLTTDSSNDYSSDDLICYAIFADNDSDSIYANYTWYRNGVSNLSGQSTTTFSVGSLVNIANLSSGNTTDGEKWSCQVQAYDSTDYEGSWTESSNLTIVAVPAPEDPGGTSPPAEPPAPPAPPTTPPEAPPAPTTPTAPGPSYSSSGSVRKYLGVKEIDGRTSDVTTRLNRTNISFILTNTGDLDMVLEPEVEDLDHSFLVHRKTLNYQDSWASRMSGIWYSSNDVFGTLLRAKIKKEQIILKPGETKKIELDIEHPKLLVGSKTVKVFLKSLGEVVLEEDITIEQESISLAALDLVPGENFIDIYASISPGTQARDGKNGGLLTGSIVIGEEVMGSDEYLFELNINKKRVPKNKQILLFFYPE